MILIIWLVLGSLATTVLMAILAILQGISPAEIIDVAVNPSALGYSSSFLVLNISFLFLLAGLFLVVVAIHQRPFRTLVTALPAVYWKRMAFGGFIWLGLAAVSSLVEFVIWRETFTFQLDLRAFLPFALLVLLFTPIQAATEELLFRGYLVQGASLISRSHVFLALLSGLLFMLPHLFNPEMAANFWVMAFSYFLFGAFLAWVSLVDGTLELAIGVHVANNLFATLVITFPESAIPSPALFFTTHFDPIFSLIMQIIACLVFYGLVFVWRKQLSPPAYNPDLPPE